MFYFITMTSYHRLDKEVTIQLDLEPTPAAIVSFKLQLMGYSRSLETILLVKLKSSLENFQMSWIISLKT